MKICNKCGELKPCKFYRSMIGEYWCDDCRKFFEILCREDEEKELVKTKKKQQEWIKKRDKVLKEMEILVNG